MPNEKKCIYCGLGVSDGVKLSKSDIIPEALANNGPINYCVCEKEHNNKFSDKFESYVINNLKFISNRFGMFGKNDHLPEYTAKYEVGDIVLEKKKAIYRESVLKGHVISGEQNGKKIKFGLLDNLKNFSNFSSSNVTEIDLSDIHVTENVSINLYTFFAPEALRLAAKVAYEWYCKQNSICDFEPDKYKEIVDFIVDGSAKNDVVSIIVNMGLYTIINENYEMGSHTLLTVYSSDRNIYVLFSFFGLVIYKVKIRTCAFCFPDRRQSTGIAIRYDGYVYENTKLSLSSEYLNSTTQSSADAINTLCPYILETIKKMLEMQLLTLRNFKYIVDDISGICSTKCGIERYNELIGYNNDKRIMGLYILYYLGKNKDKYDYTINFNQNIKNIFNVEDKLILASNTYVKLKDLYEYNTNEFLGTCQTGINVFYDAWKQQL